MKKIVLIVLVVFTFSFIAVSCDSEKKPEKTEEKVEKTEEALIYQCPMDCENGKTYDKPGSCPECKMDIKPVKEDHSGHSH